MPEPPRTETPEQIAQREMLTALNTFVQTHGWAATLTGLACIATTSKKPRDRTALAAPLFALSQRPEAQD